MAIFTGIFVPVGGSTAGSTTADLSATLAATTSTAEIVLGRYQLFVINANADINIRCGNSGMPAAAATDYRIPANSTAVYQVPENWDRIRLYNAGSSSLTYWIQPLRQTT